MAAVGPEGTFWGEDAGVTVETCSRACRVAREKLSKPFPESAACASGYPEHDGFCLMQCALSEYSGDKWTFAPIVDADFSAKAGLAGTQRKLTSSLIDVSKIIAHNTIRRALVVGTSQVADQFYFSAKGRNGTGEGLVASWHFSKLEVPTQAIISTQAGFGASQLAFAGGLPIGRRTGSAGASDPGAAPRARRRASYRVLRLDRREARAIDGPNET